jgi:ribosome biogenesis GTPase
MKAWTMTNQTGIVVSLLAGYYDVSINGATIRTRACGVFRKRGEKPRVGDLVEVQLDEHGTNYLVQVLPRKNLLGRPPLANVAGVLLVITATEPDFSLTLLNRYLVFFDWQNVPVWLYLSKGDLVDDPKFDEIKQQLAYYQKIGYQVFTDKEELQRQLPQAIKQNDVWTLAGQSGAGKSTLLNFLKKDADQATGEISHSLNRGRHTTRQVSLFRMGQGFLADTPGFSAISLAQMKIDELPNHFCEFKKASAHCKFRSCQHLQEPHCEVKRLVAAGEIAKQRYDAYVALHQEILDDRVPEYKK